MSLITFLNFRSPLVAVWKRTLTVSRGWATRVETMPAPEPAMQSVVNREKFALFCLLMGRFCADYYSTGFAELAGEADISFYLVGTRSYLSNKLMAIKIFYF